MKYLILAILLTACAPVGTIPNPSPAVVVPPPPSEPPASPDKPLAGFPCGMLAENDEAYIQCLKDNGLRLINADWEEPTWSWWLAASLNEYGADLKKVSPCKDATQWAVMLMSSLARYESGFKPAAKYTEAFPDKNGVRVVSRGLFQLSIESVNGARYKCGIKKAEDLHDPHLNIICAVMVANALVKENGVVTGGASGAWKGMARYWSPFRTTSKREAILAKAKASCQ